MEAIIKLPLKGRQKMIFCERQCWSCQHQKWREAEPRCNWTLTEHCTEETHWTDCLHLQAEKYEKETKCQNALCIISTAWSWKELFSEVEPQHCAQWKWKCNSLTQWRTLSSAEREYFYLVHCRHWEEDYADDVRWTHYDTPGNQSLSQHRQHQSQLFIWLVSFPHTIFTAWAYVTAVIRLRLIIMINEDLVYSLQNIPILYTCY